MTTAATAYAQRQASAKALLAQVTAALEVHAERAAEQPGNWGFAGDLGALEAGLKDLLAAVSG